MVVVVAGVVVALLLGLSELLGGRSLGLGVQVLDLGLTEDASAGSVHVAGCLDSCQCSHVGVAGGGLVDIGLVDDEEDLGVVSAKIPCAPQLVVLELSAPALPQLPLRPALTFFGRRRVTRVMPSMCFRPSLAMALRAFFSLREWTVTDEPWGITASPSSSESLDSSSSI